jgi:hypothetical protein
MRGIWTYGNYILSFDEDEVKEFMHEQLEMNMRDIENEIRYINDFDELIEWCNENEETLDKLEINYGISIHDIING